MSDLPYTTEVLRLAAEATGAGRLSPPRRTHTEFNPACGDRCTVDLRIEESRVTAMAQETRACVLTQASASVLGASVVGTSRDELIRLRQAVEAMLKGGTPPEAPFARYALLADVARHAGRHRCVLLPIDAALKALASEGAEPG